MHTSGTLDFMSDLNPGNFAGVFRTRTGISCLHGKPRNYIVLNLNGDIMHTMKNFKTMLKFSGYELGYHACIGNL